MKNVQKHVYKNCSSTNVSLSLTLHTVPLLSSGERPGRGGPGRDKQQVTRPRPVCGWARPAATRRTPRRGRPARRTCRSPAPRLLPVPACGAAAARPGPQRPHEHSNFTILPQNLVRVPIKDKEDSCSRGHR